MLLVPLDGPRRHLWAELCRILDRLAEHPDRRRGRRATAAFEWTPVAYDALLLAIAGSRLGPRWRGARHSRRSRAARPAGVS